MLAPAARSQEPLGRDHPCFGCEVRSVAVCGVLGCDDLARFRLMGWTVRLGPGEPLFHEGDGASRVFTLTTGALKLYRLLPDGRRQITGFMFPGDFLGLAVDDEHACTAEALCDAQLCWFPRNRFSDFVEASPDLERELYLKAAHELSAAQEQIVLLGRKTAIERVASFFLSLLARTEGGRGERLVVDLPMSRLDIADYLGLTKETVSRVLAQLRRSRLIRLQNLNRVELLDRDALAAVAAGDREG
jgi:CRP/FNR family transcriptional regulator